MSRNWWDYELYLFDLDDTLLNTRKALLTGWENALRHPKLEKKSKEEYIFLLKLLTKLFGTTADGEYWQAFVREILPEVKNPQPLAQELIARHQQTYWQTLQPFPDVMTVLERLLEKQKKMAIVTNGVLDFQQEKLKHTRLDAYFANQVFCSDQFAWRYQKPSPYMIQQAITNRQVTVKNTIFWGNADIDIMAGNLAGVTTVLIAEVTKPSDLHLLTASYSIQNWSELC